jgi:lipopolysaccharide assembly protein A
LTRLRASATITMSNETEEDAAMAEPESPPTSGVRTFLAERWLSLLLILLFVLFVAQNRAAVDITLFAVSISAPLWMTLTIIFLIGLIAGVVRTRRRRTSHRSR